MPRASAKAVARPTVPLRSRTAIETALDTAPAADASRTARAVVSGGLPPEAFAPESMNPQRLNGATHAANGGTEPARTTPKHRGSGGPVRPNGAARPDRHGNGRDRGGGGGAPGAPRPLPSPYLQFTAAEWAAFRADTPLDLSAEEVRALRSFGDPIELDEVRRIYLSLSRLLSAHVEATQRLFRQRKRFFGVPEDARQTPFVIGIAGSVSVGKSTTARLLKLLLARWPGSPKVALVTTDGFLKPNARLEAEGLMGRKGFPESYDTGAILSFLAAVKAGERVEAPVYSHLTYDVVPGKRLIVDRPDILVFEGINVLQVREPPADGLAVPMVSDFFDFSIYVDADEALIHDWYVHRFMALRQTAFRDPASYFHRYATLPEEQALATAERLWREINLVNLHANILPTRPRADLILRKGADHLIERVALRRL